MPTYTSYFNLAKPTVNDPVDADQWGGLLNSDIDAIDGLLRGVTSDKSASFTVQTTEFGQIYLCNATSAAIIATLPSAATAGNGFKVAFKKTDSSANAVTLTPNGADTIDGAATYALSSQYSSVVVVSNGSVWSVISGGSDIKMGINLLGTYTASSSATIDITSKITSDYDTYIIELIEVVLATNATSIYVYGSIDNGSTYTAGGSTNQYSNHAILSTSTTYSVVNSSAASGIILTSTGGGAGYIGNDAGQSFNATIKFHNPMGARNKRLSYNSEYNITSTNALVKITGSAEIKTTSAVNALRFQASTGNIASGTFRIYGLRKV